MMKFQKTISAVTATAFLWGAVGINFPSASAQSKPDAPRVRPTGPLGGLPLPAGPTGTASAGAPIVVAPGAKPAGVSGNPIDDLPLPGEKEFTE